MSEQQITPRASLDPSELDAVSGGIIVHDSKVMSDDVRRNQEQNDKLMATEARNKSR